MSQDPLTSTDRRLPPLPARRYFTQGEVCALCGIKPHVLQSWEQRFAQLREARRASRREVYWHHEVVLVRRIRALLLELGLDAGVVQTRLRLEALGVVEAALPAAELAAEQSGGASGSGGAGWMPPQPPAEALLEPAADAPETSAAGGAAGESTQPVPPCEAPGWAALLGEVKKELEELKKMLAD